MKKVKFRVYCTFRKQMITVGVDSNASFNHDGTISTHGVLGSNPLMQYIGLNDTNGTEFYEDDLLLFDFVEDGFERSKAGEIMKEKGATQLLLHITPSECLETSIEIYFLKDNKKLTNNDWFGYEVECGNEPYSQTEDGAIHFLKYLLNKNLRCIGNIYQNPELINTASPSHTPQ